jgi:hypothetical protein
MMLKAMFAMAFVLLTFNSAYAERISIGQLSYREQYRTVDYQATIVDHSLDIVNVCVVTINRRGRPFPPTVNCTKYRYHSQLPAGASPTSVFTPTPPPAIASAEGFWEADQNSGAVQFCKWNMVNALEPCILVQLVQ